MWMRPYYDSLMVNWPLKLAAIVPCFLPHSSYNFHIAHLFFSTAHLIDLGNPVSFESRGQCYDSVVLIQQLLSYLFVHPDREKWGIWESPSRDILQSRGKFAFWRDIFLAFLRDNRLLLGLKYIRIYSEQNLTMEECFDDIPGKFCIFPGLYIATLILI